jgi:hypothetical protein
MPLGDMEIIQQTHEHLITDIDKVEEKGSAIKLISLGVTINKHADPPHKEKHININYIINRKKNYTH